MACLSVLHDSATCRLAEKLAHSEFALPYMSWCMAMCTWNNADKSNQHGCHSSHCPSCKASCCCRGSRVSTVSGAQAQPLKHRCKTQRICSRHCIQRHAAGETFLLTILAEKQADSRTIFYGGTRLAQRYL